MAKQNKLNRNNFSLNPNIGKISLHEAIDLKQLINIEKQKGKTKIIIRNSKNGGFLEHKGKILQGKKLKLKSLKDFKKVTYSPITSEKSIDTTALESEEIEEYQKNPTDFTNGSEANPGTIDKLKIKG